MRRVGWGLRVGALLLVVGSVAEADVLSGRALLDELRRGGYVLFLRHGAAVTGHRPHAVAELPAEFRDCRGRERPLTEAGVAQIRAVGEAVRSLGIPIGRVLASPACRCIETAWYAFGRAEVAPELMGLWGADVTEEDKRRRAATLRRMLATSPTPGTNAILSAHVSNILAAVELSLDEGEALVFQPDGGGAFRLVGRVKTDGWPALER